MEHRAQGLVLVQTGIVCLPQIHPQPQTSWMILIFHNALLNEFSHSAGAGERLSHGLEQLQAPTRSSCGSCG